MGLVAFQVETFDPEGEVDSIEVDQEVGLKGQPDEHRANEKQSDENPVCRDPVRSIRAVEGLVRGPVRTIALHHCRHTNVKLVI